jgi:ribosomal protein S18 acetylase RimI-like enzyme
LSRDVLELARGLSADALGALADLEARTLAVDGGRLKLEWGVLKARDGQNVEDVLWWQGDQLVGYVGLYAFSPPTAELAGMVDPAWRRRRVATELLDAALLICRDRGYEQVLLVVPRSSVGGRSLARARGAVLEHSEHALVLSGPPLAGPSDPRVTLRPAVPKDVPAIADVYEEAFGAPPSEATGLTATGLTAPGSGRTLVVELEGSAVGMVRLTHDDGTGGVYGFAVSPAWQGRGIGRDVLRRVCNQLRDEGARSVHLEVAVDNDRALGLYTSLGFVPVGTEDYYALP